MDQEFTGSGRPLGEHIGILAVDVRRFSGHNDAQQETLVSVLPEVLAEAAERAGLTQMWTAHRFRAFRGDGYLIGFDADLVGAVVDRFFDSVQSSVRRRADDLRAKGVELRLRASLHLGPVRSFDELVADSPTGRIMVDSGRMVDAAAARAPLDHSDPAVTFVAAVVSRTVMEDVVAAGHTARQPSEFVEAQLEIASKEYSGIAYLRVPAPSGELLRSGLLVNQVEEAGGSAREQPPAVARAVSNSMDGHAENVAQARDIHGGVHDSSARTGNGSIAVTGDRNVTAGRDVDKSSTTQEFSGEFTTSGDANFGPSSGRRGHDDQVGQVD